MKKSNQHNHPKKGDNMIKKWTRAINLAGNYGAHTLRKTWGICRGQDTASALINELVDIAKLELTDDRTS